jgi:hypothetical protein
MGDEEGLRRAFDVQMRMVEEVRRELEVAEARRLRLRDRERDNESGAEGDVDGQRRRRRRRRRRPHEGVNSDDERRRRERHDAHYSRRMQDDLPGPASDATSERASRSRRGFRAFLNDAIDVADSVLFGGSSKRRD